MCLFSLLLLFSLELRVLLCSDDNYHTAYFPNGHNFTYDTGNGLSKSYWNGTTAEMVIFDSHNAARRELNLTQLVSVLYIYLFVSRDTRLNGRQNQSAWQYVLNTG